MKRYEIHTIEDADCTRIHPEVLAETDDRDEAETLASQYSGSLFGAAILDTKYGEIDFGCGYSDHDVSTDDGHKNA